MAEHPSTSTPEVGLRVYHPPPDDHVHNDSSNQGTKALLHHRPIQRTKKHHIHHSRQLSHAPLHHNITARHSQPKEKSGRGEGRGWSGASSSSIRIQGQASPRRRILHMALRHRPSQATRHGTAPNLDTLPNPSCAQTSQVHISKFIRRQVAKKSPEIAT